MAAAATTDFFALLGEPRHPVLDPERIKETFHRLSRTEHPDQQAAAATGADAAFAVLNQAQATLREPKTRLRHLLELEFPEVRLAGPSSVPLALAALFAPIHGLLGEIDALLAKKAAAPSALARALLARSEHSLREQAETRLAELETLYTSALTDLDVLGTNWQTRQPDAASRLHELYQRFAYLSRWTEQLRERLFQLGM